LIVLQIKGTLRSWSRGGPCSKRLCLLQALISHHCQGKKKKQAKNIIILYSFLQFFPRDLKCALYLGLIKSKPRVQTCLSPSQDLHLAVAPHFVRLRLGLLHFLAPEYPPKAWEEGDYAIHTCTLAMLPTDGESPKPTTVVHVFVT